MAQYNAVPADEVINRTVQALTEHGFTVTVVEDAAAAKRAALAQLPKGSEVLTVTSKTLSVTGLDTAINESGDYDAVRPKLMKLMGDPTKKAEQRRLSCAEYVIGSVHALTQDGKALIASATGSQLGPYAFGAERVVWVVGAQKIVQDLAEARDRLETYTFPLENERATAAYGSGSTISRVLTYEVDTTGRVSIIIVKQSIGF